MGGEKVDGWGEGWWVGGRLMGGERGEVDG